MEPTEEQKILKQKRIKREKARLRRILKGMDPDRLKAADRLIEAAAFMAASLQELQEHIDQHGLTCEYQNGPNQWGTKRAPEADLYAVLMPQYRATIRQLIELLPAGTPPGGGYKPGDALMAYISGDQEGAKAILERRRGRPA
ncbi:MAG: hypothetical protein JXA57_15825 [Armatimonadetes bacterium]|nr:hypothetical protein [Armatimonadota bacterium]